MNPDLPDQARRSDPTTEVADASRPHTAGGADAGAAPQTGVSAPAADLTPLAALSGQFVELVRQWGVLSNRQASSIARVERHLAELREAGERVEQGAAARVRELQETIGREWKELREAQSQPAQQLQDHATSLTQLCMTTIDAAQRNWEQSEARLAAIERELDRRLTELSREVQGIVSELRMQRPQWEAVGSGGTPWALDSVTRLHEEMRSAPGVAEPALVAAARSLTVPATTGAKPALPPEPMAALSERLEALAQEAAERDARVRDSVSRTTRVWRWAALVLVAAAALSAFIAWRSGTEARAAAAQVAEEARRDTAAARDAAAQEVAAARAEASRQVQAANGIALQAQRTADVIAAPDLVRYSLMGQNLLAGAAAQLRWSRTRGMVFSGSSIVSPPPATTYQIWLLGRETATSLGTFAPEAGGVATVTSGPVALPRPIVGAIVTLEPEGGSSQPAGEVVFARPAPPADSTAAP